MNIETYEKAKKLREKIEKHQKQIEKVAKYSERDIKDSMISFERFDDIYLDEFELKIIINCLINYCKNQSVILEKEFELL
jgi:hypothetical protein